MNNAILKLKKVRSSLIAFRGFETQIPPSPNIKRLNRMAKI